MNMFGKEEINIYFTANYLKIVIQMTN
jgi:hypothetical protein